ncbi:hypothetical protein PFISCL1PPCAC_21212 [Pristionchus fissidentatus]|uniref:MATH domain-containing protein n=1 Tax=Pristionchus fissidentatus TaxID=1538716 RepID=A0AAV5WE13_9BILA|nr:hypothetical protein PFISCL1PPCAC_21212 [Pristionchus fissidentatus]
MASSEIHWVFNEISQWDGTIRKSRVKVVYGLPFTLTIHSDGWEGGFFVTLSCLLKGVDCRSWSADFSYTLTACNGFSEGARVKKSRTTLNHALCEVSMEMKTKEVIDSPGIRRGFTIADRIVVKASFTVHNLRGVSDLVRQCEIEWGAQ